jgi:V/A-type H+-transporting ATPase subunit I
MQKVCLVVQDKYCEEALIKLREVGVVHLENKDASVDANSNAQKLKAQVEEAIALISEYKASKIKSRNEQDDDERPKHERRAKPIGLHRGRRATDVFGTDKEAPYSIDAVRAPRRPYLPEMLISFSEERKALKDQDLVLCREVSRVEKWGDFDPAIVEEIIEHGVPVYFYEMSVEAFMQLDKDVCYIKINSDKSNIRIIVFYNELPSLPHFQLPERRLSEYQKELDAHKLELIEIEEQIKEFADRRPALIKEMEIVQQDLEFEIAVSGMNKVEDVPEEHKISWLTGFVPNDDLHRVKTAASKNGWALTSYEPALIDEPPTKIKSSPLVRIIHPLLSFLGTVPGYREFDISPSYLFFFSIFFAMILGDAGYGLFLFVIAVALGFSIKKKSGVFPDVAKLLMLLTFSTMIWGALNGAWFAIPHNNLPVFLTALIIPPFNNVGPVVEFPVFLQDIFKLPAEVPRDEFKTRWYIQFLCFSLAVIQLVWARGKRIIKQLPYLSAIAQLGTLVMMFGLYFLVLFMLLGIEFPSFAIILIITGVALNLVFAEQNGGNFFVNIGKGFGNFFQLFLKTVSCFADIISYIRLFAVGLAGAMIAQIFNEMAVPAEGFGSFGLGFIISIIVAVLILVIGHGLNLALTALSVIVHGVRLNLLEYAGNHLEMEWSGYLYNPFALKQKKE